MKTYDLKNHSLIHNDNIAESFEHHFVPKTPFSHILLPILYNILPELGARNEAILQKV